jgi:EmrB/QacA subfamily drug resistance transporter
LLRNFEKHHPIVKESGHMESKQRNRILLVLFFGVLMGALDIAIVGPALTAIQKTYEVNERLLTWVFSIYVLFNLVGTPLMAKLSDQFNRRTVYIIDILLFALGSLIVAVSQSYTLVLVGRAVQGFGAGGIFPVATAVIGDTFPPEKRGSALGLIGAVFGVAFLLGPIIGGLLLNANWHWLFYINLPIALVIVILALRILPVNRPAKSGRFDFLGMSLLAVTLASFAFGINQIDTSRFFPSLVSVQVLPFLVLSTSLAPLLVMWEKRSANPVLRLDLFTNRQMVLSYILSLGAGIGESVLVFMPLLAVAAFNLSSSQASYLLVPLVVAMAIVSPLIGRLLDRHGSKAVVFSGTFLLVAGMILLGTLASLGVGYFLFAGALVGAGLSSLLGAPIRYIMLNEAASQDRSVAQGVVTLSGSIGQLIGSALVGAVSASGGGGVAGISSAYVVVGIISIFLVIASSQLKGRAAEIATVQAHKRASAS